MEYIFQIYILITIVSLFVNLKLGISLYLVYFILVPADLPLLFTSTNTIFHLCLLMSLVLYASKIRNQGNNLFTKVFKPFKPIILLYVFFFFLTPFQDYVPFGREFQVWQNEMRIFFILPVVMWYLALTDKTSVKYFNYSILIASLIVMLYAIYLMFYSDINFYVLYLTQLSGSTADSTIMGLNEEYRLIRRVSSVFMHPMNYGLFLTMLVAYLYSIREKINNTIFIVLFVLSIICVLYCGVRTPIVAFAIGVITYMICVRQVKNVSIVVLFGIALIAIISNIPELSGTIESIYAKDSDIGGSSLDLRLEQLQGCFKEISDCQLAGKGYEWAMYYMGIYGTHPVIRSFESVIFRVLCNWGVIGLVLYTYCYTWFTVNTYKMMPNRVVKALSVALVVTFMTYCIGTGDYQYTTLFMLFYSMFIINNCEYKREYVIKR